ncbi:uncharacterized protein LOC103189761, partial [Callorhinchus milii]|uniref:uncharacterized protein LOC103189761 n=1 Tax=Callorhinchus milii TaxID=7868 RepID=UPI001C3F8C22
MASMESSVPEGDEGTGMNIDHVKLMLQAEHDQVQNRTFTNWMNTQLAKHQTPSTVNDLFTDLQNGHRLLDLLEVLSGQQLPRERGLRNPIQWRSNIETALKFLRKKSIKLVNINVPDIVEGRPTIILGLIWSIILHFHLEELAGSLEFSRPPSVESLCSLDSESSWSPPRRHSPSLHTKWKVSARKALLLWAQDKAKKVGIEIHNFNTSWRSGLAFLAIIRALQPGLVDMEKLRNRTNRENLEEAFRIAEQHFNIARLLEAQDVDVVNPDEKSIITYVSQFLQFSKQPATGEWESEELAPLAQPSALFRNKLRPFHRDQEDLTRKAEEITEWLSQNEKELSEALVQAVGVRYEEKYQMFQRYDAAINDRKKSIMAVLSALKKASSPPGDRVRLKQTWTKLRATMKEWEVALDYSLPPPLDSVGAWVCTVESHLTEDSTEELDYEEAASRAHTNLQMFKALMEENKVHLGILQDFAAQAGAGGVAQTVPQQKMEELLRRFMGVRVTAKHHGVRLEFRASRYSVLALLSSSTVRLDSWRGPYTDQDKVEHLLLDWKGFVEGERFPARVEAALDRLRKAVGECVSRAALAGDHEHVTNCLREAESEWSERSKFLWDVKEVLERVITTWGLYREAGRSLWGWFSEAHKMPIPSETPVPDLPRWRPVHQLLNSAGNFLMEVSDETRACEISAELGELNTTWAELMVKWKCVSCSDVAEETGSMGLLVGQGEGSLTRPLTISASPVVQQDPVQRVMDIPDSGPCSAELERTSEADVRSNFEACRQRVEASIQGAVYFLQDKGLPRTLLAKHQEVFSSFNPWILQSFLEATDKIKGIIPVDRRPSVEEMREVICSKWETVRCTVTSQLYRLRFEVEHDNFQKAAQECEIQLGKESVLYSLCTEELLEEHQLYFCEKNSLAGAQQHLVAMRELYEALREHNVELDIKAQLLSCEERQEVLEGLADSVYNKLLQRCGHRQSTQVSPLGEDPDGTTELATEIQLRKDQAKAKGAEPGQGPVTDGEKSAQNKAMILSGEEQRSDLLRENIAQMIAVSVNEADRTDRSGTEESAQSVITIIAEEQAAELTEEDFTPMKRIEEDLIDKQAGDCGQPVTDSPRGHVHADHSDNQGVRPLVSVALTGPDLGHSPVREQLVDRVTDVPGEEQIIDIEREREHTAHTVTEVPGEEQITDREREDTAHTMTDVPGEEQITDREREDTAHTVTDVPGGEQITDREREDTAHRVTEVPGGEQITDREREDTAHTVTDVPGGEQIIDREREDTVHIVTDLPEGEQITDREREDTAYRVTEVPGGEQITDRKREDTAHTVTDLPEGEQITDREREDTAHTVTDVPGEEQITDREREDTAHTVTDLPGGEQITDREREDTVHTVTDLPEGEQITDREREDTVHTVTDLPEGEQITDREREDTAHRVTEVPGGEQITDTEREDTAHTVTDVPGGEQIIDREREHTAHTVTDEPEGEQIIDREREDQSMTVAQNGDDEWVDMKVADGCVALRQQQVAGKDKREPPNEASSQPLSTTEEGDGPINEDSGQSTHSVEQELDDCDWDKAWGSVDPEPRQTAARRSLQTQVSGESYPPASPWLTGVEESVALQSLLEAFNTKEQQLLSSLQATEGSLEVIGLREGSLAAVQHRLQCLNELDYELQSRSPELDNLRHLSNQIVAMSGAHAGQATRKLEEVDTRWEDTKKHIQEWHDHCCVLVVLLRETQKITKDLVSTVQEAEEAMAAQGHWERRDILQVAITRLEVVKRDCTDQETNVMDLRSLGQQLELELSRLGCDSELFGSEAQCLVQRWRKVMETLDSSTARLKAGLSLWEQLSSSATEGEKSEAVKCEIVRARDSSLELLQGEIQCQEQKIENLREKTGEIQELLQWQDTPEELQVLETCLRLRLEELMTGSPTQGVEMSNGAVGPSQAGLETPGPSHSCPLVVPPGDLQVSDVAVGSECERLWPGVHSRMTVMEGEVQLLEEQGSELEPRELQEQLQALEALYTELEIIRHALEPSAQPRAEGMSLTHSGAEGMSLTHSG